MDVVNLFEVTPPLYMQIAQLQIIHAKHSILIENKEGRNDLACHTVTRKPVDDNVCQVILAALI